MLNVYEWTDTMERTLDTIRQNTLKLGEGSLDNYNALQSRIDFIKLPLAFLSAVNTYAVIDLGHYISEYDVTLICSVISASIAGYLSYDWYVGSQKKLTEDYSFYKDCDHVCDQITHILSIPRSERKKDGGQFLREIFKEYSKVIAGHDIMIKNKGNLRIYNECERPEDIEEVIMDHWNLIFRPTLRRFKRKNKIVMDAVKTGGLHDIENIMEKAEDKVYSALQPLWHNIATTLQTVDLEQEKDLEQEQEQEIDIIPDDKETQTEQIGIPDHEEEPSFDYSDLYGTRDTSFAGSSKLKK